MNMRGISRTKDRRLTVYCGERFNYLIFGSHILPAGGSPAYLREFAHIAAIGWTNEDQSVRWLCGGSLIWENFILTAAHCASDDDNVPPDVARMGDINIYNDEDDEFAQQLKIVDVIRHPKHKYYSNYYDIALMKLERNVTLHNTVAPTCLWLDDEIRFPELLAAGWGRTGFGEDTTKTLLKVQLVPINNEKCSTYYQKGDRKLENGLMDHQLCAGDEKMDTCPGDSGGPLHVKLFDGWKLTPFLVGVTSFGKACGVSAPGVYVKVSKFGDWIIETLQRHGEMATSFMFEPMVCADRYNNLREYKENLVYKVNLQEYIEWSNIYVSSSISNFTVKLSRQYTNDSVSSNCSGTLMEPNVVLTTAECVLDERARPTHVVLANGKKIEVSEIIVHPSYNSSISPYYNNIAVVKLTSFAPILPFCGWYGDPKPGRKLLITGQQLIPNEESNDHTEIMTRVWERSSQKCRLAQKYSDLLPQGLQHEHLCFQNQPFLVPGSCNAMSGSAIEQEYGDEKIYIHGINLFGRDCGYGEPAVGIRLSAHKEWLESVLLPHLKSESLVYIDPDLELGDECEYADGTKGICEAKQSCPAIHTRLQYKQQISFCSNGTVVCCSNKATNSRMMAIEKEINECEERYRHLRTDQYNERSHAVKIGWQDERNTTYECYGYLISTRGVVSSASCLLKRADLPNIVRLGGFDSLDNSRVIPIERVIIHPNYEKAKQQHSIAIVRLETAVDPTENAFPTCLWQNITHSPKDQIVMDLASSSIDLLNPLYKSDCEALLNRTFDEHYTLCMISGLRMFNALQYHDDLQMHFEPLDVISNNYLEAGSPIVWRNRLNDVNYLVHMYNHGSCDLNIPCIVTRITPYIEWFKEVLQ
uniref:Peptidase S1 domain-containing protein n=1 Tax=Anopheles gambiae TaxID=7165 RepID=A0A1S4HCH8_ANOGA